MAKQPQQPERPFLAPPKKSQPTLPFRGGDHNAAGQTGMSAVPLLSIIDHEVDPLRVYKHLFKEEPKYDEHTGLSVLTPTGPTARS